MKLFKLTPIEELFITITLFLIIIIVYGCSNAERTPSTALEELRRIKLKERTIMWGTEYLILEVDTTEYLIVGNGGAVRLN